MDLFTFDDVDVFDTDYGFGDQTGLDTQYNVDDVAVYDSQFSIDGTTVDETLVTVDGTPVFDQVTVIDAPAYYDPQMLVADAPLYDPQLVVNETTVIGDPGLTTIVPGSACDAQITIVDTPAMVTPDCVIPATETTIINEQYVVSDYPAYIAPGYPGAVPGLVYDQPVIINNGAPASQNYSDTSFQASFQAQWTSGSEPTPNASGVPNTQQVGGTNAQNLGQPNAQHYGSPNTHHAGTPNTQHNGRPDAQHHGVPNAQHHGVPNPHHLGSPNTHQTSIPSAHHTGIPNAQHTGVPHAQHHGAPNVHHHNVPNAQHHATPNAQHHATPSAQYHTVPNMQHHSMPNIHHPGIPNAHYPMHGVPASSPSAVNVSQGNPLAAHGMQIPPHSTTNLPQGTQVSPHTGIPTSHSIPNISHSIPTTQYAGRPSLSVRPSNLHGARPSIMHGLGSAAHNPVVNALVTKPMSSLMSFGRKPKTQAIMQNLNISSPGGTVMNMVTSSVKATTDMCVGLVQSGNIAAPDIGTLAVNTVSLAWKAGAYAYHRSGMKKQLAVCFHEYCAAGHLELHQDFLNPKRSSWKTTAKFNDAKHLLSVYKDIGQYLRWAKVSDAEMDTLGWRNPVTVYTEKKMRNVVQQLSASCDTFGVRNVVKTDLETRFNVVSFPHIGLISLTNAFLVEGERRRRRELAGQPPEHHLVPVLGRVLSLAAICGIHEICLSDITLLLGKAPLFETVARARIAALRHHHASHVINSLLFGGSTESAARDFAQQAMQFKDQRMLVGRIVAPATAKFDPVWTNAHCLFTGPVDANLPVGTPIYMLAGWARLIAQRELLPTGHAAIGNAASQALCAEQDVHGNTMVHPGRLGPLTFTVKALADGMLMAKPRKFDRFDYLGSSNYRQGRATAAATGEEKHFGGVVGPAHCGCAADQTKARLTREWRYSEELGISSRKTVLNSIQHTRELSSKKVGVLWSSGDWAKGVFFMQTLPQSSYLQGRGECLHCAVENAALAGCPEVIACGGGRVTAAAKRAATSAASVIVNQAPSPNGSPAAGTPVQQVVTSPAVQTSPPPPYASSVSPTEQKPQVHTTPPASSDVGENKPAGVTKTMSVRRKPVGSAASSVTRKPLAQATITEIRPDAGLSPIEEKAMPHVEVVAAERTATPPGASPSGITKRKPVMAEQKAPIVSTNEYPLGLC